MKYILATLAILTISAIAIPASAIQLHPLPTAIINYYAEQGSRISGLDIALIRSVIDNESAGDPHAKSTANAVGLMQLEPETASDCGIHDRTDPLTNAICGSKTLRYLITDFGLKKGLASYNWGAGNIQSHPSESQWPQETQNYVASVIAEYDALQHENLVAVAPTPSPSPTPAPKPQSCPDKAVLPMMLGSQVIDSFVTSNAVHRGSVGVHVFGSQSTLSYIASQFLVDLVFHRIVLRHASCGWKTGIDAYFFGANIINATNTGFPK